MGLSINDSVYSCLFFFLTGLHFFHLLVGLLLCCLLFWSCSCSSSWKCYSCFWTATSRKRNEVHKCFEEIEPLGYYFLTLRTSEIHLFYNLQLFYWHFLEILWIFIFLVFYNYYFSFHLLHPISWLNRQE